MGRVCASSYPLSVIVVILHSPRAILESEDDAVVFINAHANRPWASLQRDANQGPARSSVLHASRIQHGQDSRTRARCLGWSLRPSPVSRGAPRTPRFRCIGGSCARSKGSTTPDALLPLGRSRIFGDDFSDIDLTRSSPPARCQRGRSCPTTTGAKSSLPTNPSFQLCRGSSDTA